MVWRFSSLPKVVACGVVFALVSPCAADGPTANRADEPLRQELALDDAIRFVDESAVHWNQKHRCVTCHTNGVYLATRAEAGVDSPAFLQTREFARDYLKLNVVDRDPQAGQRVGVQGVVATASFLAISDMKTTGKLDPVTRQALDHIWTIQDEDGAWSGWLKCNWGPYEVDDHFGVTLAALAVGMTPDEYQSTSAAKAGLQKLFGYIECNPPVNGHQQGMTLWAAQHAGQIAGAKRQQQWIDSLFALQHDDGGWATIDLGDEHWQREDDKPQDKHSDGFATGFVMYVLRQANVPAGDARLQRGLAWLKKNQRESGRWFTRSPRRDGKHFITQAGTNFAIAAVFAMEEE